MVRVCHVVTLWIVLSWAPQALGHDASGPQGSVTVDWPAKHVSRISSSGYGDAFGLETETRKGFPVVVDVEGRQCLAGSLLLFDIDDAYAFDVDEAIEVEILFDRRQSNGFLYSYDRNAKSEPMQRIEFEESDERWRRERLRLTRARFANRGQAGSDFGIAGLSAYYPGTPDANHTVVICELKIERSNETRQTPDAGNLDLVIVDAETGRPAPVRMGIYDETGRMPRPSDDALLIHRYDDDVRQIFLRSDPARKIFWPVENRYVFYSDGRYRAALPAGKYRIVVSRGIEYPIQQQSFQIVAGEELNLRVELNRWADMMAEGWYSGDVHIHIARSKADNSNILAMMRSEDLRVSNILQMGNPAATHFHQYAFGEAGRYVIGTRALVPGVEDPRTAVRGHTISLNIQRPLRNADEYLQYDHFFDAYREQGGISGYAHLSLKDFNVDRGLALDVPLGSVDFIEAMQAGLLDTEYWYDFLNLGFRLVPTSGSDFPYIGQPGAERSYVKLPGEFSTDAFFESLQKGHTFVTNGPLLELHVQGQPMGSTLHVSPGDELVVTASARLNPSIDSLDRLELIVHGEVVKLERNEGDLDSLVLSHEIVVEKGFWVAARAVGQKYGLAHTTPVYVTTDEQDGHWAAEKVPAIVARMRDRLKQLRDSTPDIHRELEPWEAASNLDHMWSRQAESIRERIRRADEVYGRLLDRALKQTGSR